jgi:uncharacterized RDD family membrane protein YckC
MPRIFVFLIVLTLAFGGPALSGGSVGVSSQCLNDDCWVSASSSLFAIISGLLLAAFVLFFPRKNFTESSDGIVGVWRRFGALFLDFLVVLAIITPIAALPLLAVESSYIGSFEWSFIRDFSREADSYFLFPSIFIMFGLVFFYFYQYSKNMQQTLGQYVLNYKVTPVQESRQSYPFAKRVIYSYLGLCAWPISVILALKSEKKACWWDKSTNTKAIRGS